MTTSAALGPCWTISVRAEREKYVLKRKEYMKTTTDKLQFERKYSEEGCRYIAGVDEVGRGPLCGPVVCCAVIMPLDDIIEGVDDSKKLSEKKREALYDIITEKAVAYKICFADHTEIDRINILEATKKCMAECIEGLEVRPDVVLVDAVKLNVSVPCIPIIQGDAKSYVIGAASIVAKVYRDRLMREYSRKYPEYDLAANKGYGTKKHIDAIKEFGPCPIHRRTFIKNFWEDPENPKP
ncbi:MAG: ribonuclease HII [Clostridia bacterium]|nr:ribonuclease HII [Clostridia bacterium]